MLESKLSGQMGLIAFFQNSSPYKKNLFIFKPPKAHGIFLNVAKPKINPAYPQKQCAMQCTLLGDGDNRQKSQKQ